ncbi:hypothetical protein HY485_04010 [Candidatus Woesearchaeota archaeon]|nr:hypothetical protein [Candidatus Woesearchaeota archaeon]
MKPAILDNYRNINGIYLKDDGCVVAYQTPADIVTALRLTARSRTEFEGLGVTFSAELGDLVEQKYSGILHQNTKNASFLPITPLPITPQHIDEFVHSKQPAQTEPEEYLTALAEIVCFEHAANTVFNNFWSTLATLNLRYSPFATRQRKKLTRKFTNILTDTKQLYTFRAEREQANYHLKIEFMQTTKEHLESRYRPASITLHVKDIKNRQTRDRDIIVLKQQNI